MAITTEDTYFMYYNGSAWAKLIDIKEFPDLGGAPDTIDITTLSDHQKMYLNDIKDPGSLEFKMNYDKDDYAKLKTCEAAGEASYAIFFGSLEGEDGKFYFNGEMSAYVNGAGVSSAVDMTANIAVSTEISTTAPEAPKPITIS